MVSLARVGVLLVWTITCHYQVHGKCTMHDKVTIFRDCEKYFETEYPSVSATYLTNCCKTVQNVSNMEMACVLKLCTKNEIDHMVVNNFLHLEHHCKLEWPLPLLSHRHRSHHHYPPPSYQVRELDDYACKSVFIAPFHTTPYASEIVDCF